VAECPRSTIGGKRGIALDEKTRKGKVGERAMTEWLDKEGLCYLYVEQTEERFAKLFSEGVKRPDFLVLLDSLGLIAVDVKYCSPMPDGRYTLYVEEELKKVIAFERIFRIPVWYAYLSEDKKMWHWISALKVVEVGEINKRGDNGKKFLAMKKKEFIEIQGNDDLGKLFTQRMPSLKKMKGDLMR